MKRHTAGYETHKQGQLSVEWQFGVVRRWLNALVFENSLSEFVGRLIVQAVKDNACHDQQPLELTLEMLNTSVLAKIGIPDSKELNAVGDTHALNNATINAIRHEILFVELPALALDPTATDKYPIYVGTVDWGYLHAGLMMAGRTGKDIGHFTLDELIQLGESLEDMLREGAIDAALMKIFTLPAKLLYLKQCAEQNKVIAVDRLFRSEEESAKALAAFFFRQRAAKRQQ
ncbi:hypothetical protein ABK905_02725 [Acerihabitans sp. KWT182]|uniref:Uncharacterized protein n=1 Tax=Acerihabitans sp. KWT182 TaxID=3157919 RepID=A0AAU7QBB1_9GAMM